MGPILQPQALNPVELADLVGDEGQSTDFHLPRDQQVIGADGYPLGGKGRPDFTATKASFWSKSRIGKSAINKRKVSRLCWTFALFCAPK